MAPKHHHVLDRVAPGDDDLEALRASIGWHHQVGIVMQPTPLGPHPRALTRRIRLGRESYVAAAVRRTQPGELMDDLFHPGLAPAQIAKHSRMAWTQNDQTLLV